MTSASLLPAPTGGHALEAELRELLNRYSAEDGSNTPDHILAQYLLECLVAYNRAVIARAEWYGRIDVPGRGSVPWAERGQAQ